MSRRTAPRQPLAGEDIKTTQWEDAHHWLGVYTDLLDFKVGILRRIDDELRIMEPVARNAASVDLTIIEEQMDGYVLRLRLWYGRLWELQGLWLDPANRVLRHNGSEAQLTRREYQLLDFLLANTGRRFAAAQLTTLAWDENGLQPQAARNYVARLRRLLAQLELPCEIDFVRGRGYSLVFRAVAA
jgi:DNA-binding response OmpR family regulator